MVAGVMPRREAVSRSKTRRARRPCTCWSLATSRSSGSFLQPRQHLRRVGVQLVGVGVFEGVLELRAADAVFHGEILHRLHEQRDAGDLGQLRLQAANHIAGADLALVERLEVDQNAAAVERGVGAIDADEGGEILHRRICQNDLGRAAAAASTSRETTRSAPASETP